MDRTHRPRAVAGGVYSDHVVCTWAKIRLDGVILDSFGVDRDLGSSRDRQQEAQL